MNKNENPGPALPATPHQPQTNQFSFPPGMLPLHREAIEAFTNDLDSLLTQYPPEYWVVYRGKQRLAVSPDVESLYAQMDSLGIPDEELYCHPLSPIVTRAYHSSWPYRIV